MASSSSASSALPNAPKAPSALQTPSELLARFGNAKAALDHTYTHGLVELENSCLSYMRAYDAGRAVIPQDLLTALGELHYTLLKEHAYIARMLQAAGTGADKLFSDYGLQKRMWDNAIDNFISKLNQHHPETNRFIQSYLDRCKALLEELNRDAENLRWLWFYMGLQIDDLRPPPI